jgi:elongator complex protein 3
MPNNPELLALYYELIEEGVAIKDIDVEQILKRLKVRSNSGVAVISLLTKPYACPGRCIYCPTEKNMPKSYLSREPAAARALLNKFDPYKQIWMRLRALTMNGHPVDKVEMILIGGTFNFYKKDYQEFFVKEAFRACNNWRAKEEGRDFIESDHAFTLEELQEINETSHARIIGLSIETRPDYVKFEELDWLRYLGVTKIEVGVQHLDNHVLEYNKREMTKEEIAVATERMRQAGFKIVYHMMPNLPESNEEMDIQMFKDLYSGKDFHPDMMKIYPCMILRGSLLYKMVTQKQIEYKAYDDDTLTRVLAMCESYIPNYTRLIRVIRDIPADYIIIGSRKSNLREMVDEYMVKHNMPQNDIRHREIRDSELDTKDFELTETWYNTSHGRECFLQFENKKQNKLAGFLRLRLQDDSADKELSINKNLQSLVGSALVRELHVYGTMKRVGEEGNQSQHTGFGRRLLERAEEISKREGYKKVAIISGVGVRNYYRKWGYELLSTYMVKSLN